MGSRTDLVNILQEPKSGLKIGLEQHQLARNYMRLLVVSPTSTNEIVI